MLKYPFTSAQIEDVDSTIIDRLCRGNLFANDKDLQKK